MRKLIILLALLCCGCTTANVTAGLQEIPFYDYPHQPYPAPAGQKWAKKPLPIMLSDPNWNGVGPNVAPFDQPTFKWILVDEDAPEHPFIVGL